MSTAVFIYILLSCFHLFISNKGRSHLPLLEGLRIHFQSFFSIIPNVRPEILFLAPVIATDPVRALSLLCHDEYRSFSIKKWKLVIQTYFVLFYFLNTRVILF